MSNTTQPDKEGPRPLLTEVAGIYTAPPAHWVGNGFHVRSLFSYADAFQGSDPFVLLDYAAEEQFSPNRGAPRGVGPHPHKGFETVTIAYQGEVAHRDSSGGGGTIQAGDVQWMTAGRGIVHEEFHSREFSEKGGPFEMVQLWVNLPAKDKDTPASYQPISKEAIPVLSLPGDKNNAGSLRLIAGRHQGKQGPAKTFTEMNVWDVMLDAGASTAFTLPVTHNLSLAILRGEVRINANQNAQAGALVCFHAGGEVLQLQAGKNGATVLLLSGMPLNEPVAGYGPFVMNSMDEIRQAFADYERGKFGNLA